MRAFFEIVVVVTDVQFHAPVVLECEDVRADAVEEPAIVADDEHAAAEFREAFFQNLQR